MIRPFGADYELLWQSGTLQQSDSPAGPWTNVAGASAPRYVISTSGERKFYRVQL